VIQEVPDAIVAYVHITRVQFPQQFATGDVRLLCHPLTDPGFLTGRTHGFLPPIGSAAGLPVSSWRFVQRITEEWPT
jgi:hypothetical protein